ncbi:MAG: RloB domain-containing protein [Anaerolineae bacterium]|nr:RloB domain-containing protein [Anaerolineae bacterium]MBT7988487.1 RloB domain-containing protein [Anaerolineae bacterium]
MAKKRFVSRTRRSGFRDFRLLIIAAEGEKTEKKYFDDLLDKYPRSRIHVEVLERPDDGSDPVKVINALNDFKNEYNLRQDDELWVVVDVDRWGEKLSEVAALCRQKGYGYAVSNPCFEIWLLLHIKDLAEYDEETLQEFRENRKPSRKSDRTRLDVELLNLNGSYNKSNLDTSPFLPFVENAIERARSLDVMPRQRWPNDLGTRIYLIAEKIINSK